MNLYGGILLAELSLQMPKASHNSLSESNNTLRQVLPLLVAIMGLFAMSHPKSHPEWAHWSLNMNQFVIKYFPTGTNANGMYSAIGVQLLTLATALSPIMQKILSHSILVWLGGISFGIYLLHGCVIRTLYLWLLYGLREPIWLYTKDLEGNVKDTWQALPPPELWMYAGALVVTLGVILAGSHLFSTYVEKFCEHVTKSIEEIMCPASQGTVKLDEVYRKGLPMPNGVG